MSAPITITSVDYHNPQHTDQLLQALEQYALDPMGGGSPLSEHVREHLASSLASLPHSFSLLLHVDGVLAGLANCFEGFSTFACQKLVNIHDFVILPDFRGRGLAHHLLAAIEAEAKQRNCCKLTLEVLEGNPVARHTYARFGFQPYALDPAAGHALFMAKAIEASD